MERPEVAAIASGRFERKTATSIAALTPPSRENRQPDHDRFRDAVKHDPKHDPERRAALLPSE
jgi:hypothetical protein